MCVCVCSAVSCALCLFYVCSIYSCSRKHTECCLCLVHSCAWSTPAPIRIPFEAFTRFYPHTMELFKTAISIWHMQAQTSCHPLATRAHTQKQRTQNLCAFGLNSCLPVYYYEANVHIFHDEWEGKELIGIEVKLFAPMPSILRVAAFNAWWWCTTTILLLLLLMMMTMMIIFNLSEVRIW